ncbi:WD repeat-containing protein 55 homolog [Palaemon carinicauda]|uniref:WD repeat-containing protein 55 homolog n=1 Tax=Palaemon carinicauda TaxID=392227 RepID=UPI0035B5BEC4
METSELCTSMLIDLSALLGSPRDMVLRIYRSPIFLASCAMDAVIPFWNMSYLYDIKVDGTLKGHKKHDKGFNLESSKRRNRCDFFSDIPEKMESDDEGGPVAGPSHTTD